MVMPSVTTSSTSQGICRCVQVQQSILIRQSTTGSMMHHLVSTLGRCRVQDDMMYSVVFVPYLVVSIWNSPLSMWTSPHSSLWHWRIVRIQNSKPTHHYQAVPFEHEHQGIRLVALLTPFNSKYRRSSSCNIFLAFSLITNVSSVYKST